MNFKEYGGHTWYYESGNLNVQVVKLGEEFRVEVWGGSFISPKLLHRAGGFSSLDDVVREISHLISLHEVRGGEEVRWW